MKPHVLQKKSIFNLRSFGFHHIIIVFAVSLCIILSYINLSLYYHKDSYLDGAPEGHHMQLLLPPPTTSSKNLTDSLSKKGMSSLPALLPQQVRISIVQVSDDSSRSKLAHNIDNLDYYKDTSSFPRI